MTNFTDDSTDQHEERASELKHKMEARDVTLRETLKQ